MCGDWKGRRGKIDKDVERGREQDKHREIGTDRHKERDRDVESQRQRDREKERDTVIVGLCERYTHQFSVCLGE